MPQYRDAEIAAAVSYGTQEAATDLLGVKEHHFLIQIPIACRAFRHRSGNGRQQHPLPLFHPTLSPVPPGGALP